MSPSLTPAKMLVLQKIILLMKTKIREGEMREDWLIYFMAKDSFKAYLQTDPFPTLIAEPFVPQTWIL